MGKAEVPLREEEERQRAEAERLKEMYPDIGALIARSRKARYRHTLDEIESGEEEPEGKGDSLEGGENESKDGAKMQSSGAKGGANWKRTSHTLIHGSTEEIEQRKKKIIYGSRASSKIFESARSNTPVDWLSGENQTNKPDFEIKDQKKTCKERIIIDANNKWKAIFDVFILLLVGYSCVTSMLYAAFTPTNNEIQKNFDLVVEVFFWTDLCLNFVQSYKHPETYETITDIKLIAQNYILHGWFFIDFISVFPF